MWEGVRCVGGVEVCGRGGKVWKGWRSVVGGVEVCGRGKVCVCVCVWKGWRCVEGVRCVCVCVWKG